MRRERWMSRSAAARFLKDERGSASVELVIWIPFFFFLLFLTVDSTVLFWRHGAMWDTARDAARQYSIGVLETEAEIRAYADSNLRGGVTYEVNLSPPNAEDEFTVEISAPVADISVFGFVSLAIDELAATVTMTKEPGV